MALNSYRLGELITQRREKKPENEELPIRGVSKDGFIPPKQIDADTDIYNVFYKKDFVYNPARMELGSIAFNSDLDKGICSSLYEMFFVHRTDICLPEYLALFVSQDEFARYCNFLSSGSAREYCRFANISQIKISLPSIEEQRKIVHDYKVITDRIELLKKINENLDETLVNHFFSLELNDSKTIKELTKNSIGVRTGKSPQDSNDSKNSKFQYPIIGASGIMGYTSLHLYDGRVVSTGRVGTIGKVMLWENRNWFTDNSLVIESEYIATIYSALKTFNFGEITGGSSNPKITQTDLNESKVSIPNSESIAKFELFAKPIIDLIFTNKKEIISLENLSQVLLSNISREVA